MKLIKPGEFWYVWSYSEEFELVFVVEELTMREKEEIIKNLLESLPSGVYIDDESTQVYFKSKSFKCLKEKEIMFINEGLFREKLSEGNQLSPSP